MQRKRRAVKASNPYVRWFGSNAWDPAVTAARALQEVHTHLNAASQRTHDPAFRTAAWLVGGARKELSSAQDKLIRAEKVLAKLRDSSYTLRR
jgi:hypothetical protein